VKSATAWSESSAKARVEAEPPPSVALSRVTSVTPADPVAGIVSCAPAPDSGGELDSVGVGDADSDGLDEVAGSVAVSSVLSSPHAARVAASASPVTSAAVDRRPERRQVEFMVVRR
jgi:hypothetical protein